MFASFFNRCWQTLALFLCSAGTLWAQDKGSEVKDPEWVLSYALVILFLALTLCILLRPTRRSDSAFSYDEQQAQKEEEMKQIKKGH